jgi:uncharacterized membrane protein
MPRLEPVTVVGARRSHWVMKTPGGLPVEWDSEIFNERQNELIAWRSTPTSPVRHAGAVRFSAAGQSGTLVEVSLPYAPPGGELGVVMGRLFGADPERYVEDGLENFKTLMERRTIAPGATR